MANPILRAGPYASASNYFRDLPVDQVYNNLVLPVNCNTRDWVNDEWKALFVFINSPDELVEEIFPRNSDGTITFSQGTTDREGNNEGIYFGYQAVNDFTLTGSFSANPAFGLGVEDFRFEIGDVNLKDRYFSATTQSGTFSVTLPSAIVPKFVNLTVEGLAGLIDGTQITINNLQPTL